MTENPQEPTASGTSAPPPPGGPGVPPPAPEGGPGQHDWATVSPVLAGRALHRAGPGERKVAGVCAGLARWLDVDPLLVRVALSVLALFGGSGVLVYGLAWLLVPEEGHPRSEASEALHGRTGAGLVGAVVLVLLGSSVFGGVFGVGLNGGPSRGGLVTLTVLGVAAFLAVRGRQRDPGTSLPGASPPWSPPSAPDPFGRSSGAAYTAPPAPDASAAGAATVVLPAVSLDKPATATDPLPGDPDMSQTLPLGRPDAPEPGSAPPLPPLPPSGVDPAYGPYRYVPPERPRERSRLGRATFSLALLAAGAVAAWGIAGGASAAWPMAFAVALAVTGLGLVVGAFAGRARGLIGLGLVLTLALGASTVARAAIGTTSLGQRTWAPSTVADVERSYDLGVGSGVLDLTRVQPDGPLDVSSDVGVGQLLVTVPRGVAVQVRGHVGGGELRLPDGSVTSGTGVERSWSAPAEGSSTAGDRTLVLDLNVGLGNLEVRRAAS